MKHTLTISLLFIAALTTLSCGGGSSEEDPLPTLGNECLLDADCDGDGLYTSCDDDDGDAANVAIKDGCDTDLDGFVDVYCTAYEMQRDLNGDGLITEDERDINCDTCPPGDPTSSYNPDQTDSDFDGIGDECAIDANINIGAVYDDEAAQNQPEQTADEEVQTPEETVTAINITAIDESVRLGSELSVDFTISGTLGDTSYTVELTIKSLSDNVSSASPATKPHTLVASSPLFCSMAAICKTLGPVAISSSSSQTVLFDIPEDIDAGDYKVQLKLLVLDSTNTAQTVARDTLTDSITINEAMTVTPDFGNPGISGRPNKLP